MKVKRFPAILCLMMLVTTFLTPALAAEPEENVVDLGDGFYMVETVTQYTVTRSGNIVGGEKTGKVYQGSTLVGTATLTAAFDISGSTAKAVSASITGTGSNGWTYDRGSTGRSGNKATGTAYFKNGSAEKSVTITLACSPDGTLS